MSQILDFLGRVADLTVSLTQKAYNFGKNAIFGENVERVQWATHPEESESGTCEVCDSMNGVLFDVEDSLEILPYHCFCNCEFSFIVEEEEGE